MLGGSLSWKLDGAVRAGEFVIEAIGSSPSDEMVTVIEYLVSEGDTVADGQIVASVEADKAVTEIASLTSGTVIGFLAEEGVEVAVGKGLIRLKSDTEIIAKPPTREEPGTPIISIAPSALRPVVTATVSAGAGAAGSTATASADYEAAASPAGETFTVGIAGVASSIGTRVVTTTEISEMCPT